jgi:hypothetical protein
MFGYATPGRCSSAAERPLSAKADVDGRVNPRIKSGDGHDA